MGNKLPVPPGLWKYLLGKLTPVKSDAPVEIPGGIDNTAIGTNTPAAIKGTTGDFSGAVVIGDTEIDPATGIALTTGENLEDRLTREAGKYNLLHETEFPGSSLPIGWAEAGGWTVNESLIPPGAGGWNKLAYWNRQTTPDKATVRARFALTDLDAKFSLVRKPSGVIGGTVGEIDFSTATISLYGDWDGTTTPPAVAESAAFGFTPSASHLYEVALKNDARSITLTLTDLTTGDTISTTDSDAGAAWDNPGIMYHAGGVAFSQFSFYADMPKAPQVLVLGDSLAEGSTLLSNGASPSDRWADKVRVKLVGDVAILGRGGESAASIRSRLSTDLDSYEPRYVVIALGTNDSVYADWLVDISNIIGMVEAKGAIPVLTTFPPRADRQAFLNSVNAYIRGSGYLYVDFAKALTANNDGTTWASGVVYSDNIHPNVAGHLAMFERFVQDLPQVFYKSGVSGYSKREIDALQSVANISRNKVQAIKMTGASSGTGIAVADNALINPGTGAFSLYFEGSLDDWAFVGLYGDLIRKWGSNLGYLLRLTDNDTVQLYLNAATYNATAKSGFAAGQRGAIGVSITPPSLSVPGSVAFFRNGKRLGVPIAIPAAAPANITSALDLYILGQSSLIIAGEAIQAAYFNYALTADQHLDLYENGIDNFEGGPYLFLYEMDCSVDENGWLATAGVVAGNVDAIGGVDNWLRHTINDSNTFHGVRRTTPVITVGVDYDVEFDYFIPSSNSALDGIGLSPGDGWAPFDGAVAGTLDAVTHFSATVTATATTGFRLTAMDGAAISFADAGGDDVFYIKNFKVKQSGVMAGAVLALLPKNIQPAPGQWLDASKNKLHAMQPASGSSLVEPKRDFEFRWTNTWTASSAAQYIGGVNQAVITARHFIESWVTKASGEDIEDLEGGDGADADRFVATFTPTTIPTPQALANRVSDGVNHELVYTPAAEATMKVETIIRGYLLEP